MMIHSSLNSFFFAHYNLSIELLCSSIPIHTYVYDLIFVVLTASSLGVSCKIKSLVLVRRFVTLFERDQKRDHDTPICIIAST